MRPGARGLTLQEGQWAGRCSEGMQSEARASPELGTQKQSRASCFQPMRHPLNFFLAQTSEEEVKYREECFPSTGFSRNCWSTLPQGTPACYRRPPSWPKHSLLQQLAKLSADTAQALPWTCPLPKELPGLRLCPSSEMVPTTYRAAFHTSQVLQFPRALPAKFPLLPGSGLRFLPTRYKNAIY